MYDKKGFTHFVWRAVWPMLAWIISKHRGEFALAPPRRDDAWAQSHKDWWNFHLYVCVRRLISSGQGGVTPVAFGVTSILIPAVGLAQAVPTPWRWWALGGLLLAGPYILVVAVCYSAYVALRAQTPEQYAETVLGGRSPSEMFLVLAYEVRASCRAYVSRCAELGKFLSESILTHISGKSFNSPVIAKAVAKQSQLLKQLLEDYRVETQFQERHLERLIALKERAADQLGIPRRRVCDHLLQYSPRLHAFLAKKFADNYETLVSVLSGGEIAPPMDYRLSGLARQNKRILGKAATRIDLQEDLFSNDDLHESIFRLASQHSTSSSVLEYARALSQIAQQGREALGEGFSGKVTERGYNELLQKIRFMHRKQLAYPGIAPHNACLRACLRASDKKVAAAARLSNPGDLVKQAETLERIFSGAPAEVLAPYLSNESDRKDEVLANLHSLSLLRRSLEQYVAWSREEIARRFVTTALRWLLKGKGKKLIVTHGYSKTAREVLKLGLSPMSAEKEPRVFVMNSQDSEEDMRRMVLELTDDREFPLASVSSGNEDLLSKLYGERDRILVVLGAEAYDSQRRVLHPRGADRLRRLREKLGEAKCEVQVCVVAESYKRVDDLDQFDSKGLLYRSHLDRIEIYSDQLIDQVLSDTPDFDVPPNAR